MTYLVERGSSYRETIDKIRMQYGDDAQILSQRNIKTGGFLGFGAKIGVEITFYISDNSKKHVMHAADIKIEEQKRKLTENLNQEKAAQSEKTLQEVLSEIKSLKETIYEAAPTRPGTDTHDTIQRIDELLVDNDFSPWYRAEIESRIKKEFSLSTLNDYEKVEERVLQWIGDSILLPIPEKKVKPRIIALIGPTGVGKTTTVAKLAALYSLGLGGVTASTVRMISIDTYRIGAAEQIEKYSGIMKIPVSMAETPSDIHKTIALYNDADVILVDTIGKSPKDLVKLAEMQNLLTACGSSAEVYLTVSATTKVQDMLDILRQFEPFKYKAVIVTKLDETSRIGNVLSALAETGKALAWVCDGQVVPHNISAAHPIKFLINLEGFMVNRPKLEERYGGMN